MKRKDLARRKAAKIKCLPFKPEGLRGTAVNKTSLFNQSYFVPSRRISIALNLYILPSFKFMTFQIDRGNRWCCQHCG